MKKKRNKQNNNKIKKERKTLYFSLINMNNAFEYYNAIIVINHCSLFHFYSTGRFSRITYAYPSLFWHEPLLPPRSCFPTFSVLSLTHQNPPIILQSLGFYKGFAGFALYILILSLINPLGIIKIQSFLAQNWVFNG